MIINVEFGGLKVWKLTPWVSRCRASHNQKSLVGRPQRKKRKLRQQYCQERRGARQLKTKEIIGRIDQFGLNEH